MKTVMTEEMVDKYIDEMDGDLFDKATDLLQHHSTEEVAKECNIPWEVAESLSWIWATD